MSQNKKTTKACKPSEITKWSGSFYISQAKSRPQIIMKPHINGIENNDCGFQIGTVDKPVILRNIFYKPHEGKENGSRVIPFSFYGNNEEYKPFFEEMDKSVMELIDEHYTTANFKSVYADIEKNILKLKEKWIKSGLSEEAIKQKIEEEKKNKWDDSKIISAQPMISTQTYIDKKSGEEKTSESLLFGMAFPYGESSEGQPFTNFTKYSKENGVRKIEKISFFDLPTGSEQSIHAILTLKVQPIRFMKEKLTTRCFIHNFMVIEAPPRAELAVDIDLGEEEDDVEADNNISNLQTNEEENNKINEMESINISDKSTTDNHINPLNTTIQETQTIQIEQNKMDEGESENFKKRSFSDTQTEDLNSQLEEGMLKKQKSQEESNILSNESSDEMTNDNSNGSNQSDGIEQKQNECDSALFEGIDVGAE